MWPLLDVNELVIEIFYNKIHFFHKMRNRTYHSTYVRFLTIQAYEYGLYGAKYAFIFPGWQLEVSNLWHEESAPCDIQNLVSVLDRTFYVHSIRMIDEFRNVDYNGIVSLLIVVTFLIKGVRNIIWLQLSFTWNVLSFLQRIRKVNLLVSPTLV